MLRRAVKTAKEVAKLQQVLEQTNHMLKVLHWGQREALLCRLGLWSNIAHLKCFTVPKLNQGIPIQPEPVNSRQAWNVKLLLQEEVIAVLKCINSSITEGGIKGVIMALFYIDSARPGMQLYTPPWCCCYLCFCYAKIYFVSQVGAGGKALASTQNMK